MGSPPRGRGKGNQAFSWYGSSRITPAWAGKSRSGVTMDLISRDHPRVGGEKVQRTNQDQTGLGSPPRGRGKATDEVLRYCTIRITPAWAGKRFLDLFLASRRGDHPRVGGEKFIITERMPEIVGSPPRGRGKECVTRSFIASGGITPAWAGKRLKRSHRSGIFISGPIPFHSVLHRPAGSGGSRAGRDGSPAGQPQNTGPA